MRRVPDDPVPGSLDERFSDLLDGRLGATEAAELEERLRRDPSLRREFEQFRTVVESLRRTPQEDLPPDLRQRILSSASVSAPVRRSAATRFLPFAASLLTAAAAVLLFFLLLPVEGGPARAPTAKGDDASNEAKEGAFKEGTVREEEGLGLARQVALGAKDDAPPKELWKKLGEEKPGEEPAGERKDRDAGAPETMPAAQPLASAPIAALEDKSKFEETARLSVLVIAVPDAEAEASLRGMLSPLDVAFLAPATVLENIVSPLSPSISGALRSAAAVQQGPADQKPAIGDDHVLLRIRGAHEQVRTLLAGVQANGSVFRPSEQTIAGQPAVEIQSTSWLPRPPDGWFSPAAESRRLADLDQSSTKEKARSDDGETAFGRLAKGESQDKKQAADERRQAGAAKSAPPPRGAPKPAGPVGNPEGKEGKKPEEVARQRSAREGFTPEPSAGGGSVPTPLPGAPTAQAHLLYAATRPADPIDYYLLLVRSGTRAR